jgi:hypothetical protein
MKGFSTKHFALTLILLGAIAVLSATASAEVLAASATRSVNDTSTTTHVFKSLNNAGATSLSFTTAAANKLVKITFNAECGVLGPSQSWLSTTILVDGVQANPASGTAFALCTASSTSAYNWTGAVRQSLITVPAAGAHTVQVLIDLNNGATNWWLGDSSIVVEIK